VIIILGDGEDEYYIDSRNRAVRKLMSNQLITIHTVLVGTEKAGEDVLTDLAKRGEGTFTPVGGDLTELLSTFELLAAKLSL